MNVIYPNNINQGLLEMIKELLTKEIPYVSYAILCGSILTERFNDSSDIDVVVITDNKTMCPSIKYLIDRRIKHELEVAIFDYTDCLLAMSKCRYSGDSTILRQIIESQLLFDKLDFHSALKAEALKLYDAGPAPLSEHQKLIFSRSLYSLYKDLDTADSGESSITLNTLFLVLSDVSLRINNNWSAGPGKWRYTYLTESEYRLDNEIALIIKTRDIKKTRTITELVLKNLMEFPINNLTVPFNI